LSTAIDFKHTERRYPRPELRIVDNVSWAALGERRMVKKKICMLGYYGVGKTSLVSQFVSHLFTDKYQTTVGVKIDKKVVAFDQREVTLMLWDVAGEEDDAPVKLSYVRDASGYLLVFDGCRQKTFDAALSIQQRVESEIGPRPFLLLANKVDERPHWQVSDAALEQMAARGWTVLETSAKTGERVEEAFLALTAAMLNAHGETADDD
jgi:small GTP-binding protein